MERSRIFRGENVLKNSYRSFVSCEYTVQLRAVAGWGSRLIYNNSEINPNSPRGVGLGKKTFTRHLPNDCALKYYNIIPLQSILSVCAISPFLPSIASRSSALPTIPISVFFLRILPVAFAAFATHLYRLIGLFLCYDGYSSVHCTLSLFLSASFQPYRQILPSSTLYIQGMPIDRSCLPVYFERSRSRRCARRTRRALYEYRSLAWRVFYAMVYRQR